MVGMLWGVAAAVLWGRVFAAALGFTVGFYGCSLWGFYGCSVGGEGPLGWVLTERCPRGFYGWGGFTVEAL